MGEEVLKDFSISFYNKLKNTVNGSVKCTVNVEEDKLNIYIGRMGLEYNTSIDKISSIISEGDDAIDIAFQKVVKRYRSFVNHKFFY